MNAFDPAAWVFAVTVFSTFFCTAVNAYTLTVGYPLWPYIGSEAFAAVHREYLRRLSSVITLPHVVLFFSSAALMFLRPPAVSQAAAALVCAFAWATVAISAFAAGPIHDRFSSTGVCDAPGMRALLRISRARTAMMLIASGLLLKALLVTCR